MDHYPSKDTYIWYWYNLRSLTLHGVHESHSIVGTRQNVDTYLVSFFHWNYLQYHIWQVCLHFNLRIACCGKFGTQNLFVTIAKAKFENRNRHRLGILWIVLANKRMFFMIFFFDRDPVVKENYGCLCWCPLFSSESKLRASHSVCYV